MIQFTQTRAVKLRNVQTRMQKHGEDDVAAIDLAIGVTGSNDMLDAIHSDLLLSLFKPLTEQPGELALPVSSFPSKRFPLLDMPIKFANEQVGMTLRVHYGATGKTDMVIGAVTLSKLRIAELIEGGSVELQFNLSSTDIDEKVIGKLSLLQGHEIEIQLHPAEAAAPESIADKQAKAAEEAAALFDTPPAQTPEEAFAGTQAAA